MNAWLKRCVFNLDLKRERVSEPRTLSGRLFQSLGAKYEKVLPPLWRFSTAWYGTVHFWGVFHWVLYLVPGTFLVPPQPRFQASRTVTKT